MEELSYFGLVTKVDSSRHPHWFKMAEYAVELSAITLDLYLIRENLLERYYDVTSDFEPPESAIGLILKKFLVALADEDFCYRLYAYREKVYQFLNLALDVGLNERDENLAEKVRSWLRTNEGAVLDRLNYLREHSGIKTMIERRHGLTHRLQKEEIAVLGRGWRFSEWELWEPDINRFRSQDEVDQAISTFQVDNHCRQVREKLQGLEDALSEFETGLCREVLHSLRRRALLRAEL